MDMIVEKIVENGHVHYKVSNPVTGEFIHCDLGEINEAKAELLL